ncbi:MAG: hypothetical protein WDO73_01370 [Ignavibacteriota bacterium]
MLVGLAMAYWQTRAGSRRGWIAAVAALVLIHNVGYLWTKKRAQFEERAAPPINSSRSPARRADRSGCGAFTQSLRRRGRRPFGGGVRVVGPDLG